jgi:hypothetical protein
MADNSDSRLDRLEALAEKILEDLRETREGLQETRAIANSNARTIQALMEQQTTERLKHEQTMAEMRQTHQEAMNSMQQILTRAVATQEGLTKILVSLDEDRPTILRRLMKIEDKVDKLLERNQA